MEVSDFILLVRAEFPLRSNSTLFFHLGILKTTRAEDARQASQASSQEYGLT